MPPLCVLVVGGTGATGRRLIADLLERGAHVRTIVRSAGRLPAELRAHERLTAVEASLLELSDAELAQQVKGCSAIASCLGHTLSFKGIYGQPRRLVTDATRRLCAAVKGQGDGAAARFVLMNTTGNRNRDLHEPVSLAQRAVVFMIRCLLPPHADNEDAADYLRTELGQADPAVAWVVVRPDSLVESDEVSAYELHPSPTRSAIFNPGTTSRINVAHFMAELIANDDTWEQWKGQMPVIYNSEGGES